MTRYLQSLQQALDQFDVAVLDQWGVLHDGSTPYPHAADALELLASHGKEICIVSNSGKRAELNRQRIKRIGLPTAHISTVVTSGEALWEDLAGRRLFVGGAVPKKLYPICAALTDAHAWSSGNDAIELTDTLDESVDAIMLMGLADGTQPEAFDGVLHRAIKLKAPIICSNPDKKAPRADGLVMSPGALADRYVEMGGHVIWYGKPNANIFVAVQRRFDGIHPRRFLMVGDSAEHDIAGAQAAGFKSALVRGGLHADEFAKAHDESSMTSVCNRLIKRFGVSPPDFSIDSLA